MQVLGCEGKRFRSWEGVAKHMMRAIENHPALIGAHVKAVELLTRTTVDRFRSTKGHEAILAGILEEMHTKRKIG